MKVTAVVELIARLRALLKKASLHKGGFKF